MGSSHGTAGAADGYGVPLGPKDLEFRDEVVGFLESQLTDELAAAGSQAVPAGRRVEVSREWQRRLHDAGLAAIGWPREHGGRDATPVQQLVFNAELGRRRAPEPINRSAINQLGPTIIQWGDDAQRSRYLPRILSGEDVWCQGFSEPDAGSDLASLRTRAVPDGDDFVVTGQKIWTSKAAQANWIYLLVRTDPAAPKHDGISFLLAPLDSPGLDVRPIRQITGGSDFSEVFLDDVRIPRSNLVGPLHGGWKVANSTLGFERVGQSRTHRIERRLGIVSRMAFEADDRGERPADDGAVLDRLVDFTARVEALRQIASQATAAAVSGRSPGPEASVAKLLTSETDQAMSEFGLDLAGTAGIQERGSAGAAKGGNVALSYLVMRAATIGAGTSEIQRNVIGEKLLGLPRDRTGP